MKPAEVLAETDTLLDAARAKIRAPSIVPMAFVAFCTWIGIALSPGQSAIAKVAYDGAEPGELEGEERRLAAEIFGPVDVIPPEARSVFVGVCGGRGGKTARLGALKLVHGMYTRDLSSLAPGQHPGALVVAPNDMLRQEAINYAIGAIRSKPELRPTLIVPKGTPEDGVVSGFSVRRPDGAIVDFVGGVATKGGYGARGRAWTDALLDECAFFRDASAKVNDKDIFDAASPRVLPGGLSILLSTPWAELGLLYDKYAENFGKPTNAIVAHAPTLTLNPSSWAKEIVSRGYAADPENAAREYGAQFMKAGTTVFFTPSLIEACVDDALDVNEVRLPGPGDDVSAGADLGFRSDSAALAITHFVRSEEARAGQLVLAELLEKRPEPGRPLKPGATCADFRDRMLDHGATLLMLDQHYIETARETLDTAGLAVVPAPASPDEVYVRARELLRSGTVKIPRHERLVRQLKEIQGKPLPGGRMQIIQPRWAKGGHGDLASAFVLGLWQLAPDTVAAPPPAEGSKQWEEREKRARAEHYQKERERKPWEAPAGAADRGANAFWRRRR